MEIKERHRKIIAKRLKRHSGVYKLERIKKFPKKIKFHFHLTDGFSERVFYYRMSFQNSHKNKLELYCKLSPIILLLHFNLTFWTEGGKWMERYKIIAKSAL